MRIAQLFVAALVMLTISLSWAVVVDLTPASQRPFVGSSQDNSELSLALGYNGFQRLLGSFGFGGGNVRSSSSTQQGTGQPPQGVPNGTGGQPPAGFPGGNGGQTSQGTQGGNGSGGMFNTGTAGPLRLFNEPLGGQIVWLLPLALLGMLALAWQRRPHLREGPSAAIARLVGCLVVDNGYLL